MFIIYTNKQAIEMKTMFLVLTRNELVFVLLSEAIASGEKVPTSILVHVPDMGFLTRVLGLVFVDEIHQEEPSKGVIFSRVKLQRVAVDLFVWYLQIIGQVVLFLHMDIESMRNLVQIILSNPANEAIVFKLVLHSLHLITKRTKRINDETWSYI